MAEAEGEAISCVADETGLYTVGPVKEDIVFKQGLLELQRAVGEEEMMEFPKRPNGTNMMLRQGFFERILSREMALASSHDSDISAAQADVKHLSLAQLLRVRCDNIDAVAAGGKTGPGSAQAAFMEKIEKAIPERLGERLLEKGEAMAGLVEGDRVELVRTAILVYGVHAALPPGLTAGCGGWIIRLGGLDGVLQLGSCELGNHDRSAGPGAPILCHRLLSRERARIRKIHWQVGVSQEPAKWLDEHPALKESPGKEKSGARAKGRRSTAGAAAADEVPPRSYEAPPPAAGGGDSAAVEQIAQQLQGLAALSSAQASEIDALREQVRRAEAKAQSQPVLLVPVGPQSVMSARGPMPVPGQPGVAPVPQQHMQVAVPPGAAPGAQLTITTPTGRKLNVAVPQGVQPGQQFMVALPPGY